MSSLAMWARQKGYQVSGSDRQSSRITIALEDSGIPISYQHSPENIKSCDIVVYTQAISSTNPELCAAMRASIPTISRGDFLGYMMSFYNTRIGVSGTHGKSTTTAMISHIFLFAGGDPTIACGAIMPEIDGASRIGSDRSILVYEACEYRDSFLSFHPTDSVITNIELDHTDFFENLQAVISSFGQSIEEAQCVYINMDNPHTEKAVEGYKEEIIRISLHNTKADYWAKDLHYEKGKGRYTLMYKATELCPVELSVIGEFNVYNSLCAAAVAHSYMIPPDFIGEALSNFTGVERRFECKGQKNGVDVYDDYAHHPDEVDATLSELPALGYKKIYLVFQPHTYTRTKDLWDKWVSVFKKAKENGIQVILADIYAAREVNNLGVSSEKLAREVDALYLPTFGDITDYIRENAKEGDLLLTMGAGQANRVGEMFLKK
jgi:UDP-N-acetylmuramate--alanine ligase